MSGHETNINMDNLLNDLDNLYSTINSIYSSKTLISRVLYITKMKEHHSDNNKVDREGTLSNIRDEIKRLLKETEEPYNLMIFYISTLYAFVAIENSNENLSNYLVRLHELMKTKISNHESVNIIAFVEESSVSYFPVYYKYEGSAYDKESQQYKDKTIIEKGWLLYDQLFCNFGKCIKPLIQNENDFVKNEIRIKREEQGYTKFIPSMDEIYEFTGHDFISLDQFVMLYSDLIDIELDEDKIWPCEWHFNV